MCIFLTMKGLPPPPSSVATCFWCKMNTNSTCISVSSEYSPSIYLVACRGISIRIIFQGFSFFWGGGSVYLEEYGPNLTSITVWYLMRWHSVHAHLRRWPLSSCHTLMLRLPIKSTRWYTNDWGCSKVHITKFR